MSIVSVLKWGLNLKYRWGPVIVTYGVAQKELKLLEKELASISQEAVQNCFSVCISSSVSDYVETTWVQFSFK